MQAASDSTSTAAWLCREKPWSQERKSQTKTKTFKKHPPLTFGYMLCVLGLQREPAFSSKSTMRRPAPRQMATSSADSFSRSERKGAPNNSSSSITAMSHPRHSAVSSIVPDGRAPAFCFQIVSEQNTKKHQNTKNGPPAACVQPARRIPGRAAGGAWDPDPLRPTPAS